MTNSNTLKRFIRESLLSERVFGAQAFVYHGSKTPPDKFIDVLLNDELQPGRGDGSLYGKGLYAVYDLKGTRTEEGSYGDYIYKLKINLYGFIIFDPDVAVKVYGKSLSPAEQAQLLGKSQLAKKLEKYDPKINTFTSEGAIWASKFLAGKVKGLIYTGSRDGRCAVIYDPTVAVPTSWKNVDDSNWELIDRQRLKSAIGKSVTDAWEEDKYTMPAALKNVMKLPPAERVIHGNLYLFDTPITSLPFGLKVEGDLDLGDTPITSLPVGLQVDGHLDLAYTKITSLPTGLRVGLDLNLRESSITSLPADLKVGGDIDLRDTPVKSLPADLNVGGDINLTHTGIKSLPAGLKVGGNIYLGDTEIDSLPAGLQVGGYLNLKNTLVASLPADIQVGGGINLFNTPIKTIPAGFKSKGYLELANSAITSLPIGLHVRDDLSLAKTPIAKLPAGLKVDGQLDITGTAITSLPDDLQVDGGIVPRQFQLMYEKMLATRQI